MNTLATELTRVHVISGFHEVTAKVGKKNKRGEYE